MSIYIYHMLGILLLGFLLSANTSKVGKRIYLFIQCVIFIVLFTIRSSQVGRDTFQFVTAFNVFNGRKALGINYSRDLEVGFEWLCKVVGSISNDYHILFLVIGLFIFPALCIYIGRNSKDVIMSLFLFSTLTYFSFFLSSMRQAIAIGIIIVFSELALKRGRYVLFIVGVIIASLFHTSAIIAIALVFCHRLKFEKKYLLPLAIMAMVFAILSDVLFRLMTRFLPYAVYIGTQYYDASLLGALFTLLMWLFVFGISAYYWLYYEHGAKVLETTHYVQKRKRNNIWRNIKKGKIVIKRFNDKIDYSPDFLLWSGVVVVLISALSMRISVVSRALYYFAIYCLILLPNALELINRKKTRNTLKIICIAVSFGFWIIIAVYRPEWYNTVPYISDVL